jgi:hypothetical protein
MSNTLVQARPTTFSSISPDMAGVCLFSLLGVMLSAAVLSYTPSRVPAWTVLKTLTDHPNRNNLSGAEDARHELRLFRS